MTKKLMADTEDIKSHKKFIRGVMFIAGSLKRTVRFLLTISRCNVKVKRLSKRRQCDVKAFKTSNGRF